MYPEPILPVVAHIPHAGTKIPFAVRDEFLSYPSELWRDMVAVTDWYTDELYGLPGIAISQTPINRIIVDLERYADDQLEPKAEFGQGVIYSHNTAGECIRRELSISERQHLLDHYYRPWHTHLALNIEQQLMRWGSCLLLDCHSFPDEPFAHEDDRGLQRPDICLGTSEGNTPHWLVDACEKHFLTAGYSVAIDFPYAGCLVPDRYLNNTRIPAIMIEINRRLYLRSAPRLAYRNGNLPIKSGDFNTVRHHVWSLVLRLSEETICRYT